MKTRLLACACLLLACSVLHADRIILRSGSEVTGAVLRNEADYIVVDLGSAVLRLLTSDVAAIIPHGSAEPADKPAEPADAAPPAGGDDAPAWQIYRTASLEPGTIEQKSEAFGQAVVMVTCPGGQGSGFLISPDGYLITNYHVVAQETLVRVTVFRKTAKGFEPKVYRNVRIVAINPLLDLALLKIDEEGETFEFAYLGSIEDVEVGNQVFAIGNPLGLTRTVSQGIISTRNRNFAGQLYLQTTTDINPGNSGGPLFNLRGEVIGVTSMGYLFLGGLNFAIPVDVVKRFVDNRDAFAVGEDNPNAGFRYLQPAGRGQAQAPPAGRLPALPTPLARPGPQRQDDQAP